MYLEQKNYNKATIAEIKAEQKGAKSPIINGGYPTYNTCNHTTLDMSHLEASNDDNWMHTLSIKLDDNRFVTVCVMKPSKIDEQVCLDVVCHGKGSTRVMNFKNGGSQSLENIGTLAVINEIKE